MSCGRTAGDVGLKSAVAAVIACAESRVMFKRIVTLPVQMLARDGSDGSFDDNSVIVNVGVVGVGSVGGSSSQPAANTSNSIGRKASFFIDRSSALSTQ